MTTFKPGDLVRLKPDAYYKDTPIGLVLTKQRWNAKAAPRDQPNLKKVYPDLYMYHKVLVNGEVLDVYIDHLEALEE